MSIAEILTAKGRAADLLSAARAAFLSQGYKKTSVAEIAEASEISMAHIYNFYPSKIDLACAVVAAEVVKLVARLETITDPNASASARLSKFLLMEFEETYRLLELNRGLADCLQVVERKRPQDYEELFRFVRQPIHTILHSGNLAEEFDLREVRQVARHIHAATTKFRFPQLHSAEPHEIQRKECVGVIKLILRGVEKR
ncbi:Bacterial regulatory protein, tetR family [Pseudovibrio axinellae]|uniref:Bacterial regulatory protein, tetR family n=1 Tax=Pseudovibrio axinellae TaxID=989403 RepID=A0A166A0Z9_9HYPH|nr:TetR/AcrR family transcriptional regulator [Pseudovibrio axinellae]KZL20503.1 Bacterial regulatory protein, tetR family [Pseudovibrio axinellae]SEQ36384.1 transcriptional regulator, TetR family [Pseudovibrio axinellae]